MEQKNHTDQSIDIILHHPERRKQLQQQHLYQLNVLIIVVIFAFFSCFLIFGKRPTESHEENRTLAKCPEFSVASYLDGTFTTQFSEFFNDAVPMRSFFKSIISEFRACLGIHYDDGATLYGTPPKSESGETPLPEETTESVTQSEAVQTTQVQEETTPSVTEPSVTETATEEQEDADGEIANNILVINNRGLMLYGGSMTTGQTYAQTLNQYKQELGEEVNVYSLVAPTAVSFYLPEKYSSFSASETDNIDNINSFLNGVIPVDAYSILYEHKDEAIYSRTDHHWQPLGAYYAGKAFAEAAGVPYAELSDYETVQKDGYVGTLYGYTNNTDLKNNPEPFIYYVPQNNYTTTYYDTDMTNEREGSLLLNLDNVASSSWYLVFMGGDERITHVTTDCQNNRKLVIIKDSYGNALVPLLTQSFSEIWVIDMRYFELGAVDFIKEQGITDVLFAMNTFSATGGNSAKLQSIMY
jgi:hypothetical protein